MNRSVAVILAALAILVLVSGTALAVAGGRSDDHRAPVAASHAPGASDDETDGTEGGDEASDPEEADDAADGGAPSEELLSRLVQRLADAGITTDADTLAALAVEHGVGGAVRMLAWEQAGADADQVAAMLADGEGWGAIAHELDPDGTLGLHPGLGWIMGQGGGHGRDDAPGQEKRQH